jgi:hypothetical protein
MVMMTSNTLVAEDCGEPATLSDHYLRNEHFVLGLRLSDDEFADLVKQVTIYEQSPIDDYVRSLPESQYQ